MFQLIQSASVSTSLNHFCFLRFNAESMMVEANKFTKQSRLCDSGFRRVSWLGRKKKNPTIGKLKTCPYSVLNYFVDVNKRFRSTGDTTWWNGRMQIVST